MPAPGAGDAGAGTLGTGQFLDQEEAQTGARRRPHLFVAGAPEALEDVGDLAGFQPATLVLDGQHGLAAILLELHAAGTTLVVVTHDEELAGRMQGIVRLHDGRIVADSRAKPVG